MSWWTKVSGWAKSAWAWLSAHPAALAAAVGTLIGAYFMWKSDRNKVATFQDALIVQKAKNDIARAEAQAEMLEATADAAEPRALELKKQIAESKRKVVEITEGPSTKDLSDEEVARLFSNSGL